MLKIKKYYKVRYSCHYPSENRGDSRRICNLKYSAPKEISIVFTNNLTMI